MIKQDFAKQNTMDWLLESNDIGVRHLALRDLAQANPKELATAKKQAHTKGPIANVLAKMKKEGYWRKPGAGYSPKYKGSIWSIILLAQLGASIDMDKRIELACSYLLDHSLTQAGQFTVHGTASATIDCLQGNLCAPFALAFQINLPVLLAGTSYKEPIEYHGRPS